MNKKGGALSIIVWMIGAVVIIFFLAGYTYFHQELTNAILNASADLNTNIVNMTDVAQKTIVQINNAMSLLQWISFIMIVVLAFAILIENFYIRQHPILFFIHILIVIIGIVGAIYISNAYEDLLTGGILSSTLTSFNASTYLVLYLPIWVAMIGIFGIILLVINANRDPEIRVKGGL